MLQFAKEGLLCFSLVSEENKTGMVNAGCLLPIPHPWPESPFHPKSLSRAELSQVVRQLIDCNAQKNKSFYYLYFSISERQIENASILHACLPCSGLPPCSPAWFQLQFWSYRLLNKEVSLCCGHLWCRDLANSYAVQLLPASPTSPFPRAFRLSGSSQPQQFCCASSLALRFSRTSDPVLWPSLP